MTIVRKTLIKKETGNNIVGVQNDFNARVRKLAYDLITTDSTNIPNFSGHTAYGTVLPGRNGYSNQKAIESNQLDNKSIIESLIIGDTIITANTLWNLMKNITKVLNRIRPFTSIWYHRMNTDTGNSQNHYSTNSPGERVEINRVSGVGFFKETLPDVTSGSDHINEPGSKQNTEIDNPQPSKYWVRTGSATVPVLNPTQTIIKNTLVTSDDMNTAIQNCYNEWYEKCYDKNSLTYKMYTCHLNCHHNCHSQRSRR